MTTFPAHSTVNQRSPDHRPMLQVFGDVAVVRGMSHKRARQLVKLLQKKSLHYIEVIEFDLFEEDEDQDEDE